MNFSCRKVSSSSRRSTKTAAINSSPSTGTRPTGVTADMISKIYEELYADSASGSPRFTVHNFSDLVDATESGGRVTASVKKLTSGDIDEVQSDVLVMATGFSRPCPHPLLTGLADELCTLPDGKAYDLDSSWRIKTRSPCDYGIFLQGYGERTHGFSEVVLSMMPRRARTIAAAV